MYLFHMCTLATTKPCVQHGHMFPIADIVHSQLNTLPIIPDSGTPSDCSHLTSITALSSTPSSCLHVQHPKQLYTNPHATISHHLA